MKKYITNIEVSFLAADDNEARLEAKRISRTTAKIHEAASEVESIEEFRQNGFNNQHVEIFPSGKSLPVSNFFSHLFKRLRPL